MALVFAVALFSCDGDGDSTTKTVVQEVPEATTGALNINVEPASAEVVVTGPASYSETITGNKLLVDLAPGVYTATATAADYNDGASEINVVAGQTSSIFLMLQSQAAVIAPTTGSLNVNVNPPTATVVVTGPAAFTETFTANQLLTDLAPGTYTVTAAASGFGGGTGQINVIAGLTSSLSLNLLATPIPATTIGSLNVIVNPASATVVVTGPSSFTQTFTGNRFLTDLAPGVYTATATASGFTTEVGSINVIVGETSILMLVLDVPTVLPTVGSLNINVTPAAASVVVTGPAGFTQTFVGNRFLTDLAPGQYSMVATAIGYGNAAGQINVVAGQTSSISLILQATPIITEAPRAVYRDGSGNLIPLTSSSLQSGKFVFYAWIQDLPAGIVTTNMIPTSPNDPGAPLLTEQVEYAPSYTQNIAAAWVGYTDSAGVVRPVIGADVRWEIDQWWTGRVNSMQFGTSDDNRSALGYGVFDDQADTRTNNARLTSEGYPLFGGDYPLYNQSGILTPNTDGYTWVSLFSPDAEASGRIVLVATVNGEEIGKQILFKNFAPTPELEITKTVDQDIVTLVGGVATATWTVTITNVGLGDATNIDLNDFLASGSGANYVLGALPAGAVPVGDGFTYSFALPSILTLAPGNQEILTFSATVDAVGTYCNEAEILEYSDELNTWTPLDLNDQACFTAIESNVSIVKDFVADDNTTSLGKSRTVAANAPAKLRVRVYNNGTAEATGVEIIDAFNDAMSSGDIADYLITIYPPDSIGQTDDGFATTPATLGVGSMITLYFTIAASVDGVYCDTATVTATSGTIGIGSDSACLTVATPELTITKTDAPFNVMPGASYTSTIVVSNSGTATAYNVVISDLIGFNSDAIVWAIYVSSSLNGVGGTLASNTVTANTVSIAPGASVTFIVVSSIPAGAASGTYCDTASYTSSNAGSDEATACVDVPAYSALQTQLIDLNDPVVVGSNVTYFSVMYVEKISNEGVNNTVLTYSLGTADPADLGEAGEFRIVSTMVYLDSKPIRDASTGLVLSDTSNATALLLTAGVDYTVDNSVPGKQVLTMHTGIALEPDTALYAVHVVSIPSGTLTNRIYTTGYIWISNGLIVPSHVYEASGSEPTTVLP